MPKAILVPADQKRPVQLRNLGEASYRHDTARLLGNVTNDKISPYTLMWEQWQKDGAPLPARNDRASMYASRDVYGDVLLTGTEDGIHLNDVPTYLIEGYGLDPWSAGPEMTI